jgi:iron only hydrogenase large subunit-like protein
VLNGVNPPANLLEFEAIRGFDSVKKATVDLGVTKLNVAVLHGIVNAKPFIEAVQRDTQQFDFIEIMACAGGCIGGGGQPYASTMEDTAKLKQPRMSALYRHDANQEIRLSCDNPDITRIYAEFLGKPLGKRSHKLLHVKL